MLPSYAWNRYFLLLMISWAFFVLNLKFNLLQGPEAVAIFGVIYMWIPGILALWAAKQEGHSIPVFRQVNRYWIFAPAAALALGLISIPLSIPFGDFIGLSGVESLQSYLSLPEPSPGLFYAALVVITFAAGCTINAAAALGEELFWRGYLWNALKDRGFLKASYLTGILWGVWHVPLIYFLGYNYPGHPFIGSLLFIVYCTLLSPLLSYFREKGRSVLPAAFFHGTLNAGPGLSLLLFQNIDPLWVGLTGLPVLAFLLFINLCTFFYGMNYANTVTNAN